MDEIDGVVDGPVTALRPIRRPGSVSGISIFPVAYGTTSDQDEAAKTLQGIVDFSRTILVKGSTGDVGQIFDNLSRYF